MPWKSSAAESKALKRLLWSSISDEGFQGWWPNNQNCDPDEREYQGVANIPLCWFSVPPTLTFSLPCRDNFPGHLAYPSTMRCRSGHIQDSPYSLDF